MIKKIMFSIFIFLIYIPISVVASYSTYLFLNSVINVSNLKFISAILLIVALLILFALVYLLHIIIIKFSEKVEKIKSKKKFMFLTVIIPVFLLCLFAILLNYNVLNIDLESKISSNSDIFMISSSLCAISTILLLLAIIYEIIFVMYEISQKIYSKKHGK